MSASLRFASLLCLVVACCSTSPAGAMCFQCSSDFACQSTPQGARVCLGIGQTCSMAGACYGPHPGQDGGLDDPLDEALMSVTVLDEAPTALGATGVRIEHETAFDLAGEEAARGWAQRVGGAARPTLLAGLMHGHGVPMAVRTREGDGFVLERRDSRRGIKLVVRSLFAGQAGHVILSRYVEAGDLVALRATVAGRSRVVLLHVLRIASAEGVSRIRALQAAVASSSRARAKGSTLDVDLVPMPE